MIIKLPICSDNKIIYTNFLLEKKINKYTLQLFNRNYEEKISKIKVPLCNNFEGISYLDLMLPMELNVINNKVFFNNFMQKILLSQNNLPIDFFYNLEVYLKQDKNSFLTNTDLNNNDKNLWKYWSSYDDNIPTETSNITIKKLWEVVQLYLNFGIFLIYKNPTYTNKTIKDYLQSFELNKKITTITNSIKNIKYSINSSNDYTFNEHFNHIEMKKSKISELKIGFKYFIKNNNKFFQIEIKNIIDNMIYTNNNQAYIFSNYEWYFYIPNLEFTNELILFNLLNNKYIYAELFEKTNLKIEPIHSQKLLEFYTNDNNDISINSSLAVLRKFFEKEFDDFTILANNNYSEMFFEYITKKYTSSTEIQSVFKILFTNYNYPLKQNKLDKNFDNILYYSINNLEKIVKEGTTDKVFIENNINDVIPFKVRTLYYNIIQLFHSILIKNNYQTLYFNQKFFNDYLHRSILKNILSNKTPSSNFFLSKLSNIQQTKITNILQNTLLCIDVGNRLTWKNLPKNLAYLEIFYTNKELILNGDKLNKNIFIDNYDSRIKRIIEYPYEMFKYLRKEKDFIKWLKFLGPLVLELFHTPISLSSDDLNHLGKIIFLIINIKEQNLKDHSYIAFLNYSQKYNKLVIDNSRVNIKIKEYFGFIKCTLNLGFLAKHLTYNKPEIELEDDIDKTSDIILLEENLKNITKKYYKYKFKYFKTKNPNQIEIQNTPTSMITNEK